MCLLEYTYLCCYHCIFACIFYNISYHSVISLEELCFVKRRFNKKKRTKKNELHSTLHYKVASIRLWYRANSGGQVYKLYHYIVNLERYHLSIIH